MRPAPSQMAATLDALSTSMTVGNMKAINRPAASEVSVRSSLALPKRARSWGSRTNARTTRIPMSCSRRTLLTESSRSCMSLNNGTIRDSTRLIAPTSTGMLTSRIPESPTSCCRAMKIPPMAVIGAVTMSRHPIRTSI